MPTQETPTKPEPHQKDRIKVRVNFPISPGGPFHEQVDPETTAAEIKQSAMAHFEVAEDGQHAYYLSFGGAKVAEERTIGDVADGAEEVKFTLVKELIQG
jgi:hypothetical protein